MFIVTDHKLDSGSFMREANQRGERIVNFFIKTFFIAYPMSIIIEAFGTAVYSLWVYGYINYDVVFYPYKFMYATILL